jgi:hypothetical protein
VNPAAFPGTPGRIGGLEHNFMRLESLFLRLRPKKAEEKRWMPMDAWMPLDATFSAPTLFRAIADEPVVE